MGWLEFSDLVGLAIVIYVSVLARNDLYLANDIRKGILFSGAALAILYVFDMS